MPKEIDFNRKDVSKLKEKPKDRIIINPHKLENIYSISNYANNKKIVLSLCQKENETPLILISSEEVQTKNFPIIKTINNSLEVNIGELSEYLDELELAKISLTTILEDDKISNPITVQSGYDFLYMISEFLDQFYENENNSITSEN